MLAHVTTSNDHPADREDATSHKARDPESLTEQLRNAAATHSRTGPSRGRPDKRSPAHESALQDALNRVPLPELAAHFVYRVDPGRHARIELHVKDGRLRRTHVTDIHGNMELVRLDEQNKRARAKRRQARPKDPGA